MEVKKKVKKKKCISHLLFHLVVSFETNNLIMVALKKECCFSYTKTDNAIGPKIKSRKRIKIKKNK